MKKLPFGIRFLSLCLFIILGKAVFADENALSDVKGDARAQEPKAAESLKKKDDITVITIKRADRTGNKKNEIDGTDIIVLEGGVVVSVEKDGSVTTISADTINYNRAKDMLYAEGSVKLLQTGKDSGNETVTANSLLFNTATLEGIFDGGRIVQAQTDSLNIPSGSTLIVASDIFGRDDSGTVTFKNGALTFCDEDPPHWKIKASRIWLLPGGEFAFFNALLYVGQVPVFYLPAFWYPKDELVFNPVFGFRQREGYFFQTTTYILGRKPLSAYDVADQYSDDDDESDESYYSFVKPSKLKDQERQGLMLHNLDSDFKGDTVNYVKIMADWYASLGYMIGIDGTVKPKNEYVSNLKFNAELGFSNTVFQKNGVYSPYEPSSEKIYSDSSNFLGIELPYRYKADLKLNMDKPLSITLSMPLYSDPYFTSDFGDRTETMDWIDYLISNPSLASETDDKKKAEMTSFSWNLSGTYNIPVPKSVKPYVSSISVSDFSSSVLFSSLNNSVVASSSNPAQWKVYTPERKFFYPSQINPFKISGKISGTLLSLGSSASNASVGRSSSKNTAAQNKELSLTAPAELADTTLQDGVSQNSEDSETTSAGSLKEDAAQPQVPPTNPQPPQTARSPHSQSTSPQMSQLQPAQPDSALPESALPKIAFSPPAVKNTELISYSLSYLISPSYISEFSYSSTGIAEPSDFDWSRTRSTMVLFKSPVNLTSNFGYKGNFLGLTDTFLFEPVYQSHPYISTDTSHGGYTQSGVDSIRKTDYAARKLDLTNTNEISVRPFYYTEHFKETGITWNTTVKMVRTKFVGDADNPEWDYITADLFDEECVTVHTLNMTLGAKQLDDSFGQKLVLSTTLPPQVDRYYGTLTFTFPYTSLSFETGIKQISKTDTGWKKEPFKESLSLNLGGGNVKFTQAYTYELEEEYKDSLRLSFSAYDFHAAYTASYTTGYDFNETSGWVARSKKEFLPYSLSLSYVRSKKTFRYWKNRISWAPSLSSSLVYDFLRPTNSYFKFTPAITFKINEFLDIEFSSGSRNDVIYRYVQQYFGPEAKISGETNWIKDAIDSFRFDDESKRRSSGFKLENFKVSVKHDLHDWDFASEFKIEPRLVTKSSGEKYYDYRPYFTISVVWRPMTGMKTKIVDEYGDWELNP
ncbi:LPS-assembly protein LptD [Treponema parvum]|uniref:LPS-assembly protein LptD n=1 Tax=Treponema parvum TaxID=138851 RepID=UPI001AEC6AB0|nr:LPS-assembly protein LptD [Treponema parvum]QTQ15979.1 LPS-assembly protein LptD [Treponema parvum]